MSSPVYYNHDSAIRFKKRKARFSFSEVHVLLDEVRKNRSVVVGKFNRGVPTDTKKRTWAEITARVNEIGECQREVIEVIKKWSDLKCDTKRKVVAMRSGTVPNRGLNSRLSRDLSQTEKIVLQILEMDEDDQSTGECGLLGDDDDNPEEEEMEEEDMMGMQSSPNGRVDLASMRPPPSYGDSSQPAYDFQYEVPPAEDTETPFGDSDDDQREDVLPSTQPAKSAEMHQVNNGIHKPVQPQMSSTLQASAASLPNSGQQPHNSRDSLLQNASLSLQEQHATNMLLETVSRSLELLAESVQQLAETQQEFVRESLQLQRETVQVLRDFTGGAISLMHDKLNGRPAL
ncbi:nuclear apoptosis-inducing factor 1 [Cyprinodon tularosa]|uniref:Zgc:153990 n=1 Tax=Cyprinodon variegatus TaxID=28743 RepID=A0A3Q2CHK2_CYPVA|nr:PREDICTED: nuclear apoptosis-inducing factor 1-like [Cyprinodon variegatus]XP_015242118.1 PREDICTED: nuclear apoptosis-inducing factor 1-like [Cyprinodon variegatus]XP_015242119.1 PREDICTED: nuclear apoptosis-inducing factor 1-like [Cyprinodon variegatus]XP_038153107.1 nuclear apoptosis-inducing factor 1 [Cyprinodon tularosa]XP_038153108.1 nuclear apoptosis-inducing factor 1 [Cyprinodon tularosa]